MELGREGRVGEVSFGVFLGSFCLILVLMCVRGRDLRLCRERTGGSFWV